MSQEAFQKPKAVENEQSTVKTANSKQHIQKMWQSRRNVTGDNSMEITTSKRGLQLAKPVLLKGGSSWRPPIKMRSAAANVLDQH